MTSADDIEAQAMAWLVRLDALQAADPEGADEDASQVVRADLVAWCEADPRRQAAYIRLSSAWQKADQLRRLSALHGTVDIDLLAPAPSGLSSTPVTGRDRSHRRSRWTAVRRVSVAAGAIFVIAGAITGYANYRLAGERFTTGVGGFERLLLADGTTVELDTDSAIRVHLSDRRRHIVLLRGQANFKVAADARRPFEVRVAEATVRALGTAFSVRLRAHQHVEVLVTEGRVGIGDEDAAPILSAGEAVTLGPQQLGIQPVKVQAPDIARKLSWTQGRLTFDGQTLETAVGEFNRYNRRELVIADPAIAGIKIGGSFQPTDPQSFVVALERSFGVKAQENGTTEIRLMRARE